MEIRVGGKGMVTIEIKKRNISMMEKKGFSWWDEGEKCAAASWGGGAERAF